MTVLLTVLSAQRSTLGDRSTHAFTRAGGVIGRSAACDWALPDDSNTLSARHAAISHNGHGFVVTDTSTNGVYLNVVDTPLGRGQSAPLANGDTLYLGSYIVSVAILKDLQTSFPQASLLAAPAPASAAAAGGLPPGLDFGAPAPPWNPPAPAPAADWSRPPAPAPAVNWDALGPLSAPMPASPPMLPVMPAPPAMAALPPMSSAPMPSAPLSPAPLPSAPASFAPMPAFAPASPAAQPNGAGSIPDDFDFSDLMPGGPPPAVAMPAPAMPMPPVAMPPPPAWPEQAAPPPLPMPPPAMPPTAMPPTAMPQGAMPQGAMPQGAMPPVAMPPGEPAGGAAPLDALALLRQRAMARAASIDLSQTGSGPQPAPPRPAMPFAASAMPGGGETDGFWRALQLDASAIPAAERAERLEQLGHALREAASGLVRVLSGRKSMKDELRLDQTRLAPQENNPFKFFASGDEALQRVVVEGRPGYLPLDLAVAQGFADIQAHEVASAVAMQAVLQRLLADLSPAKIEGEVEPGLLGRRPDKGRLWERFAERHGRLTQDLDRTMREMLADEFSRAYARVQDSQERPGQETRR